MEDKGELKSEVYPSAPLRAVAMEFYFDHQLDARTRFGTFQRKHAQLFPNVVVKDDESAPGTVLLLEEDRKHAVAIAPTMFSVIAYRYTEGFEGFREWAAPLIKEAMALLDVRHFTSVGYKYENVIDLVDGLSAFDVVRLELPKATGAGDIGEPLFLSWKHKWPEGDVSVDLGAYGDHMHLDILAKRRGPIDMASASDAVLGVHRMASSTFEDLITPQFRDRLRRKPS